MGYPSEKNFDITFINRTNEILDEYDGKHDFTILINCLLGLLILPNEFNMQEKRKFNFDFLQQPISAFSELKAIFEKKPTKLRDETGNEFDQHKFFWLSTSGKKMNIHDITLGQFLIRIRNGFAHMNVTPTKEGDQWVGIRVRNYTDKKTSNFEVYFTQMELYNFAKLVTSKYIGSAKI